MDDIMTIYEVAEFVGVHVNTVRLETRFGNVTQLPLSKKVGTGLYDRDEVLRWMDERRREGKKVA